MPPQRTLGLRKPVRNANQKIAQAPVMEKDSMWLNRRDLLYLIYQKAPNNFLKRSRWLKEILALESQLGVRVWHVHVPLCTYTLSRKVYTHVNSGGHSTHL